MARALHVKEGAYEITLGTDRSGGDVLSLSGTLTIHDPAPLNDFFDQLHDELRARGARLVAVDLRELKFINSTGFKPLIYWVNRISELEEAAQYRLKVLSSSQRRWQMAFLSALSSFAPSLVSVEVDAAG